MLTQLSLVLWFRSWSRATAVLLISSGLVVLIASSLFADEPAPLSIRDRLKVQTLLKLDNPDLSDKPELKDIVVRYARQQKSTDSAKFFELAEKFSLQELAPDLASIVATSSDDSQKVAAVKLLLKFQAKDELAKLLQNAANGADAAAISVLGMTADAAAQPLLEPIVLDGERSAGARSAAVSALGRTGPGQKWLLALVEQGKLAKELNFAAANVLLTSADEAIKSAAGKHLTLPATADSKPLPPVAELVKLSGDAAKGRTIFTGVGLCNKCHKVKGEGKDVGPDLSEIGSKLSREAMYVSILDPSAGINFNFETYTILTEDGTVVSGIIVSQTDDTVVIKTAEAVQLTFERDAIMGMKKSPTSMMPQDLQKQLTADNLVDVVEFLSTLKKPD